MPQTSSLRSVEQTDQVTVQFARPVLLKSQSPTELAVARSPISALLTAYREIQTSKMLACDFRVNASCPEWKTPPLNSCVAGVDRSCRHIEKRSWEPNWIRATVRQARLLQLACCNVYNVQIDSNHEDQGCENYKS